MLKHAKFIEYVERITEDNIEINSKNHLFKHLNIDDQQLISRAAERHVYGASTFDISSSEIIETVKEALMEYSVDLVDWINDPRDYDDMVAIYETDKLLGHGYYDAKWHTWRNGACNCHRIAVVLEKIERKYDTFFRFKTIYCEPTDADIAECSAKTVNT